MSNLFSVLKHRAGFTLMEILMVVMIALSAAAFAVPAYKKTQERNQFTTAQGFFMEVYNALAMCINDQLADPDTSGFSKCYDSTIQYDYLTNPGDGVPPYLQPYNTNRALQGFKIIANTVSANNIRLTLSKTGSPYSATITNGALAVTVTK